MFRLSFGLTALLSITITPYAQQTAHSSHGMLTVAPVDLEAVPGWIRRVLYMVEYAGAPSLGVRHFEVPGRVPLGEGHSASEAVLLHLFVKAFRAGGTVTLRGLGFAQSLDREVYGWSGHMLSQSPAVLSWQPSFLLKEVHVSDPKTFTGAAQDNSGWQEHGQLDQPRLLMPIRYPVVSPLGLIAAVTQCGPKLTAIPLQICDQCPQYFSVAV